MRPRIRSKLPITHLQVTAGQGFLHIRRQARYLKGLKVDCRCATTWWTETESGSTGDQELGRVENWPSSLGLAYPHFHEDKFR